MLITNEYRYQNAALHNAEKNFGLTAHRYQAVVMQICNEWGSYDVLDYGCGKGNLNKALPFPIAEYDPAVQGKHLLPKKPHDILVSIDVLEHVEPECLDDVLCHMASLTKRVAALTICTCASSKTLPDGRNSHLIIKPIDWWVKKVEQYFTVMSVNKLTTKDQDDNVIFLEDHFFMLVEPRIGLWTLYEKTYGHDVVEVDGLVYPRNDYLGHMEKRRKQLETLDVAMSYVKTWDVAIDCGAFAGEWSRRMADWFSWIYAFEPIPINASCAAQNCHDKRVVILPCAASDHCGTMTLAVNQAMFGHKVKGGVPHPCLTIDSLNLNPGFIKIDAEGADLDVLRGAERTITRNWPVLCVEVKDGGIVDDEWKPKEKFPADEIQKWLLDHGYKQVHKSKPDEVWVHD